MSIYEQGIKFLELIMSLVQLYTYTNDNANYNDDANDTW